MHCWGGVRVCLGRCALRGRGGVRCVAGEVCVACLGRCALRVWGGVRCVSGEECVALLGRCALRADPFLWSRGKIIPKR